MFCDCAWKINWQKTELQEKNTNFTYYFNVHIGVLIRKKKWRPKEVRTESLYSFLNKETRSLWRSDKTKGFGLGQLETWRKLMGDKGHFGRFVCIDLFWCWLFASGDKNVVLFLVKGGYLSLGKLYALLLGRKEDGRNPFQHLLFLKCLQCKIINTPNNILDGHIGEFSLFLVFCYWLSFVDLNISYWTILKRELPSWATEAHKIEIHQSKRFAPKNFSKTTIRILFKYFTGGETFPWPS